MDFDKSYYTLCGDMLMKIAIPVWNNHVSTVFDFADCLLLAIVEGKRIKRRMLISLGETTTAAKAARLSDLKVDVLLCDAISMPLARIIDASGITIIPSLKGTIEDVLAAYLTGHLFDRHFILPGFVPAGWQCRGKGRRQRNRQREWHYYKKGQ